MTQRRMLQMRYSEYVWLLRCVIPNRPLPNST